MRTHQEKRFEHLLASMDIPVSRKQCNHENVLWFLRSGAIKNMKHKNVHEAIVLAQKLS